MPVSVNLFAESDNELKLEGLRISRTNAYINDANVVAHVCEEPILHPDSGEAISENGGTKTGIPCANTLRVGDKILILGSNYREGVYDVETGSTTSKIVINVPYVEHTFSGKEEIYKIVENGANIPLAYDSGSDGDYYGTLSKDAMLVAGNSYYLFIIAETSASVLTTRVKYNAVYA